MPPESFLPSHISKDLKYLFALSRTPHGLIDMAAPVLAALLCLGHFPAFSIVIVGVITVFAGYTAVYALNDVIDFQNDKKKVCIGGYCDGEDFLDGALIRHPMAKGVLSLSTGLVWTMAWALIALAGAWWLNPVCLYIFVAGCLLEASYCLLWQVSPLRAVINGVVKTLGAVAAVYAVDPEPSLLFLVLLFLWIFCWEIGGQNIPNDWVDIEEDRQFGARTIPAALGLRQAGLISLAALVCALFLNFALIWISPLEFGPLLLLAALAANVWLLLRPVLELVEKQERQSAMALFNKASYYPLAIFILVLTKIIF